MKQIIVFIYFLFILFLQLNPQQATPVYLSSSEDTQNDSPSLYEQYNDLEKRLYQQSINRYYKRYLHDYLLPERQRRFGNTKYGRRSLEIE